MYNVFEELLKEKGVKTADVCKATGLRQSLFSDWKAGRYTPKLDKLQKIATYFDVPVERFTDTVEPTIIKPVKLFSGVSDDFVREAIGKVIANMINEDEIGLLEMYRKLNEDGKDKLTDYLLDLLDMPKYTTDETQGKLSLSAEESA